MSEIVEIRRVGVGELEIMEIGIQGLPGPPGKSAYQFWLEHGNIGTEEDFLATIGGSAVVWAQEDW